MSRVTTPLGAFESYSAAARVHGVSRQCVWDKVRRQMPGWSVEGDERPARTDFRRGRPRKPVMTVHQLTRAALALWKSSNPFLTGLDGFYTSLDEARRKMPPSKTS